MNLTISLRREYSNSNIILPDGKFAFINHDDLANDDKLRIGMPEVMPLYWVEYYELTSAWQWFWFRQLVHSFTNYKHWDENKLTAGELSFLKLEWKSLTHGAKAFTNNAGTDVFRDYIRNVNLGEDNPKQGAITTCGNVVKIIGNPTNKGTPIETLDGSKSPPPIEKVNRLTAPWLIFCATNVAANKEDGYGNWKPIIVINNGIPRHKVDPFPNLAPKDTLVPLVSNGNKVDLKYTINGVNLCRNYIRTSRLISVSGEVPTPYVQSN